MPKSQRAHKEEEMRRWESSPKYLSITKERIQNLVTMKSETKVEEESTTYKRNVGQEKLVDRSGRVKVRVDSCEPFARRMCMASEKRLKERNAAAYLNCDFKDFACPSQSRSPSLSLKRRRFEREWIICLENHLANAVVVIKWSNTTKWFELVA